MTMALERILDSLNQIIAKSDYQALRKKLQAVRDHSMLHKIHNFKIGLQVCAFEEKVDGCEKENETLVPTAFYAQQGVLVVLVDHRHLRQEEQRQDH